MPKRKLQNEPEPKTQKLKEKWIPECAYEFYEKYPDMYKNLKLVGPFRVLYGEEKSKRNLEIAFLDRFPTDLAEMQTFLIGEKGRYCFWRDEPGQVTPLVVYCSDAQHFPDIKIVGNRVEHAILHMKKGDLLQDDENVTSYEKDVKKCIAERKKVKMGEAPHDVGIYVKMKGSVGYRCLFQSSKTLKSTLERIVKSKEIDQKAQNVLDEEFRHLQIANDESDFGMGLEFGHFLFLANSEKVKSMMMFSLKMAYSFLGRQDFSRILEETLKIRDVK